MRGSSMGRMDKRERLALVTEELRQLLAQIDETRIGELPISLTELLLEQARAKMVELADLQDDLFDLQGVLAGHSVSS